MFLAPLQSSILAPLAHTMIKGLPRAKFSTSSIPQSEIAKVQKILASSSPVNRFFTTTNESDDIHKKIKERLAELEKLSKIKPAPTVAKDEDSSSSVVKILRRLETLEQKTKSVDNSVDSGSHSTYVKICDTVFNKHKIRSAHVRDSYFYIKYPYILEVVYQQPHTEVLIGNENFKIPITSHTTTYSFKYTHKESAEKDCQKLLAARPC